MTCTFKNTKHASLTVVKETDPATDPQDFDFDLTGTGIGTDLDLDTDPASATPSQQTFSLNASQLGAKTVTETAVAGWDLTGLTCAGDDDSSVTPLSDRKATLDIEAGENVTCTFKNTKHASLTVVKETDPATDPQDFDFDLTGTGIGDGSRPRHRSGERDALAADLQPQRLPARRQDGDRDRGRRLGSDRPHLRR